MLSINSTSILPLYSQMEKSDTYRRYMRSSGFELFFKPPSSAQHRERKRLWAGLFTADGYITRIIPLCERMPTLAMRFPV